jgi:flagellar basal body-associated protein FliL
MFKSFTENMTKSLLNRLTIFIIGALILFAVTGGAIIYWTVTNAFNAKRITDAQVKVYQAQAENVGKPQIIEQRYFSPQK